MNICLIRRVLLLIFDVRFKAISIKTSCIRINYSHFQCYLHTEKNNYSHFQCYLHTEKKNKHRKPFWNKVYFQQAKHFDRARHNTADLKIHFVCLRRVHRHSKTSIHVVSSSSCPSSPMWS